MTPAAPTRRKPFHIAVALPDNSVVYPPITVVEQIRGICIGVAFGVLNVASDTAHDVFNTRYFPRSHLRVSDRRQGRLNHEDRRHWWDRPDRLDERRHSAPGRPRCCRRL